MTPFDEYSASRHLLKKSTNTCQNKSTDHHMTSNTMEFDKEEGRNKRYILGGVTNLRNYGPRNLRNPRNLTKITYFDRNIYFERIFNNDVSKQLSLVINLGINS